MSLKEILEKPSPNINDFSSYVRAWAKFVEGDPLPNITNYRVQQELLEHVKGEPIIDFEGSEAHLDGTYREPTFAGIFSRQLKEMLEEGGDSRNRIATVYRYRQGLNDNIALVISDGNIVTIENNTTWELPLFDGGGRNESIEAWPRVIGGATENGKWHLYSDDFRTGIYHKHFMHVDAFEEIDAPKYLKALVEEGERAVSFSHRQGFQKKLIPSQSRFVTNRGRLVVLNAIGKDKKWLVGEKEKLIKSHEMDVATQRWHFRQANQEYLLYPDGQVYDAAHPRLRFYRIDKE